jgi:hypothetical protein
MIKIFQEGLMKEKKFLITAAVFFSFLALNLVFSGAQNTLFSQTAAKKGDIVWAEWKPNAWYHGKVADKCDMGWMIHFDDGDKKCCHPSKVVVDIPPPAKSVKKGSSVLAEWTDSRYYPGVVADISQGTYMIHFDDGDKRAVPLQLIRLR